MLKHNISSSLCQLPNPAALQNNQFAPTSQRSSPHPAGAMWEKYYILPFRQSI